MEHPDLWGFGEWKPLARGGHAVVWKARQSSLNRLVAVKVYQGQFGETNQRRVLTEAAAAGRLSGHPGIVTAYDAGILPDDRPYLVMELCPGGSLTQWVKPENRLAEERVRRVGVLIAEALAAVHACGLVHRDVKPANILIDSYGNPKLADFGQAAPVARDQAPPDALSLTPAYAPLEAFGMQPATEFGDVFSLAATLYALLAGGPARAVGAAVTLEQMVEVARRPIDRLTGVADSLMDVLMAALSDDPAARPTAAVFCDQLSTATPPRIAKRGLHLGGPEDASSVLPGRSSAVAEDAAISSGRSIAGSAAAADARRARARKASASAPRRRRRSRVGPLALAVALVAAVISTTAWLISRPTSSGVSTPAARSATTPGGPRSSAGPSSAPDPGASPGSDEAVAIQLKAPVKSAKPFQAVLIQGTHPGRAEVFLRVQRREGAKWLAFPLPTKTDQSGQFMTYVELGAPGRYWLRVLDPKSGEKSKPFVLVVTG